MSHKPQQQQQQVYWIGCSGTGYVVMNEDRLESLLQDMPTLRFLLLGHPNMAQPAIQQRPDGSKLVEIPHELEISQSSFLLLVNCFFGLQPLPPRTSDGDKSSRLTELTEVITKLGGCARLEQQCQELAINPLTPAQDVNNKYTWAVIQYDHISQYVCKDMMDRGYSYTITKRIGIKDHHYFRAER